MEEFWELRWTEMNNSLAAVRRNGSSWIIVMNSSKDDKLPHISIFFERINQKNELCISETEQFLSEKSNVHGIRILKSQSTQTDNLKLQKSPKKTKTAQK